ncbi:MAG TPA: hypothetical protein VJU86_06430 [Pyrinomonadaceae bacterium]|nr:hypothetical protein [Pyrinomonadaceae bacterium]
MKKTLHVVICLVTLLCGTALAQNPSTRDEDEAAIRAVGAMACFSSNFSPAGFLIARSS